MSEIPARLLEEAADWLVRLQCGDNAPATRAEFEHWRQRSPEHAAAWLRAEAVLSDFLCVPKPIARRTLSGLDDEGRRRSLRTFVLLAIATPGVWLLWRQQPWLAWQADLRTATGEQKTLTLADGTQLTLNTDSAIGISFSGQIRRLRLLKGEIMVNTASDPATPARPFVVDTADGSLHPIGTRFSVRRMADATRLAVFSGAVRIVTANGREELLTAHQGCRFDTTAIDAPQSLAPGDELWTQGMLVASNMRLAEWTEEISRYRPGLLRCHPAVAELRVSGAFPLTDTDASIDLLLRTRPLAARRLTRYWVSLEART